METIKYNQYSFRLYVGAELYYCIDADGCFIISGANDFIKGMYGGMIKHIFRVKKLK